MLFCVIIPVHAAADPYARLAKKLTRKLGEWSGRKAAVTGFRYADGRDSAGGELVAAALETAIAERGGLALVSRADLDKVLSELKLHMTGLISPETAKTLGRMSGADVLVTGTLSDEGGSRALVQARVIAVESGEVLRAAKAVVPKTWKDSPAPAAAPDAASGLTVTLRPAEDSGAARRVGDRALAFRYAFPGGSQAIRVYDVTDPEAPQWIEVPERQVPGKIPGYFSTDFTLAGRSYRLWSEGTSHGWDLHAAPVRGWRKRVVPEEEAVVSAAEAYGAWARSVRSAGLVLASREDADQRTELVAHCEPLGGGRLRATVYNVVTERSAGRPPAIRTPPMDVLEVRGVKGGAASSRIIRMKQWAWPADYRLRYDAESGSVAVESLP